MFRIRLFQEVAATNISASGKNQHPPLVLYLSIHASPENLSSPSFLILKKIRDAFKKLHRGTV
jgi:hypothetical protein